MTKEKVIEFINGCLRNPKTPVLLIGYLIGDRIITKRLYRTHMKSSLTTINSLYNEVDGNLINKVNGAKIIGIKKDDGIPYSLQNIKEIVETKQEKKQPTKKDNTLKELKLSTAKKSRPESSLINEFGDISIKTKTKGDKK